MTTFGHMTPRGQLPWDCKNSVGLPELLAACAFLLVADSARAQGENIGEVQQALAAGPLVDGKDPETFGSRTVTSQLGICSASMLTRHGAIRAAHCVRVRLSCDRE
jgi:hypothetical protein